VSNVIRTECDFFEKRLPSRVPAFGFLTPVAFDCDVTPSLVQLSERRNTDKTCDTFRDFRDF